MSPYRDVSIVVTKERLGYVTRAYDNGKRVGMPFVFDSRKEAIQQASTMAHWLGASLTVQLEGSEEMVDGKAGHLRVIEGGKSDAAEEMKVVEWEHVIEWNKHTPEAHDREAATRLMRDYSREGWRFPTLEEMRLTAVREREYPTMAFPFPPVFWCDNAGTLTGMDMMAVAVEELPATAKAHIMLVREIRS